MAPPRDLKDQSASVPGASAFEVARSEPEAVGDVNFAAANFGDAVTYYGQALLGLGEGSGAADRVRLLLKIADSHRLHGQHGPSLAALARAEAALEGVTTGLELGKVLGRKAIAFNLSAHYPEALEAGRKAYVQLRDSNENQEVGHLELTMA